MSTNEVDVAVIGSGPGGYAAAIAAAKLNLKTACIDKNQMHGGTCLRVGCIPSKTLLQATEYYYHLKEKGKEFGIEATGLSADLSKMMERKESVVKGLADGIEGLFKKNKLQSIHETAAFISAHELRLSNGETLFAKNIIIATGSRPISLPFLPFDEKRVLSSTGALALRDVPKKMLVIGAGVIGVELASVYNRLGADVTLIEMLDHICPPVDQTVASVLYQTLQKQGLTFLLNAKVENAELSSDGATLAISQNGEKRKLYADVVLVAVGRVPCTEGLNLQKAGLSVNEKGQIAVDGVFCTSVPHIYAIGDVIDGPMLAHKASEEGYAVAKIIAGKKASVNYMVIPNVIYTSPEVAAVGLSEKEAKEAGLQVVIGKALFKGNSRARCMGETDGVVKVIGDKRSHQLLGVHICGANASEMIAAPAIALNQKATLEDLAYIPYAHPTLSETIKEAVQDALEKL